MEITDRDVRFLQLLATAYLLTAKQAVELVYGEPRVCRRRTKALTNARIINRYPKKHEPERRPVFYLARAGRDLLADRERDASIDAKPTKLLCNPAHVAHAVSVGQLLLDLPNAFEQRDDLVLASSCHEHEPVNPEAEPAKRKRLYTVLKERPRLVCMPDASFEVTRGADRVPFLVEYETGATGVKQVAQRKWQGYQQMAASGHYKTLFPHCTASRFLVLVVCPNAGYRDRLAKELPKVDANEHRFWRLVSKEDLDPKKFLTEPIVRTTAADELQLLVRPLG